MQICLEFLFSLLAREQCLFSKKRKEHLPNTAIYTDHHLAGTSGNLQALDTSDSQMNADQINNFAAAVVKDAKSA